jgi:hypothetical protein
MRHHPALQGTALERYPRDSRMSVDRVFCSAGAREPAPIAGIRCSPALSHN